MKDLLIQFDEIAERIESEIKQRKREIKKKRASLEEIEMFSQFDPEEFNKWIEHPYDIRETRKGEFELTVPRMFNFNVGHMIRSSPTHNTFIVNKFSQYLGAIPAEFEKIFKFKDALPLRVFDGVLLTGEEHQAEAWDRYRDFLQSRQGKDKIKIKKGSHFQLLASLIDDGIMPFMPKPVESQHLIPAEWHLDIIEKEEDRKNVQKRLEMEFFKDAVKTFLRTGACGLFWAMGVGKTLFGLMLLSMVRVGDLPNLIVAGKYTTLKDQWAKNLKLINPAAEIEIINYQSLKKIEGRQYGLKIIDEGQNLPADTFASAGYDNSHYRAVLSATPIREDKRTEYIFALSGEPIGLDWRVLIELGLIKVPDILLYLCDNYGQKKRKLAELLKYPMKTLIYSFGKKIGKDLSKTFGIPFVYGQTPTKDRLSIIKSSFVTVVSSVGKEGISIRDLERTISYNFLFGSSQEETQFFGRVLHGESEGQHILMMTYEEHERYAKRLFLIKERGFKIREEHFGGRTYKAPQSTRKKRRIAAPRNPTPRISAPRREPQPKDTSKFPFLDERDRFEKEIAEEMIFIILQSEYAKFHGGLTLGDIRNVLDHWHIKYNKPNRQVRAVVKKLYDQRKLAARREGKKRRYFLKMDVGA